ncbi:hypothetical protein BDR22DRAFT_153919 [Usnea florida]
MVPQKLGYLEEMIGLLSKLRTEYNVHPIVRARDDDFDAQPKERESHYERSLSPLKAKVHKVCRVTITAWPLTTPPLRLQNIPDDVSEHKRVSGEKKEEQKMETKANGGGLLGIYRYSAHPSSIHFPSHDPNLNYSMNVSPVSCRIMSPWPNAYQIAETYSSRHNPSVFNTDVADNVDVGMACQGSLLGGQFDSIQAHNDRVSLASAPRSILRPGELRQCVSLDAASQLMRP